MKHTKKFLIALLCLILCVAQLTACKKDDASSTDDPTGTTPPPADSGDPTPEEPPLDITELAIVKNDASEYTIVYPANGAEWERQAASDFKKLMKSLTGVTIAVKADSEPATDKEIVFGKTARETEYDAKWESFDKGYRVFADDYRLVFAAGSAYGMEQALKDFFKLHYAIDISQTIPETTSFKLLSVSPRLDETEVCNSAELPFLNVPLSQYTIVREDDYMLKRMTAKLNSVLKTYTGIAVPEGTTGNEGKQLKLVEDATLTGGNFKVAVQGTDVVISAGDYNGFGAAFAYLAEDYAENGWFTLSAGKEFRGNYASYLTALQGANRYAYEKGGQYRVMYYNTLWGSTSGSGKPVPIDERQKLQLEMVSVYMPDVLGLQEFESARTCYLVSGLTALGYAEAFDANVSGQGEYLNCVPIFYNTNTVTLIDSGYLHYTNQNPNLGGSGKDWASKALSWGVFESKKDGARFIVLNTHMCTPATTATTDLAALQEVQRKQAAEAVALLNSLIADEGYDYPVILGGDMNASITYPSLQYFVGAEGGFTNARGTAEAYNSTACTHNGMPEKDATLGMMQPTNQGSADADGTASIDHLLVRNNEDEAMSVKVYGVVLDECTTSASDHLPVFVDFSLADTVAHTGRY